MTENSNILGLGLLSLALFISLSLNVIFCIRRRTKLCRDERCFTHICTAESPSQDEGHHNLNDDEQQNNLHGQLENPIYGNISSDRRDSIDLCYEIMTMQLTRDRMKSLEPDLNYASLDLKMAKKRMKKNRHQQGHAQGGSTLPDEMPVHLTPPTNALFEVEADMDAHLPSRDTSTMVSHSSIYLNSQQIAQETQEMARERGINMARENVGWEGIRRREDGQRKGEQGSEDRKDRQDSNDACTQLAEVEAIQSGTDRFISSFSHDSDQQD